ncbi:Pyranose dehydrogenase 1 [Mycena sanguinolenta]|uniref:Pyranose dehydrogenase 1 n=1 Tax=Mycena sanguinolenta TaxID=230812 RepID=A0A8H6XNA3_9AGAR|nr:Pyranose dehydrogenase 1 [Mycena sanguinolenta]
MAWLRVLTALALGAICSGAIIESIADLTKLKLKFDYIVVGGGTSGAVIGNRLTENKDVSVLIVEAGGSNANVLDIIVPAFCTMATPQTPQDWNYTTIPQPGLNGRAIAYPRGFVLGGSSSVNYLIYTRGARDDFDRFARVTGDEGWSWDSLIPYILKNERFGLPADHHNTTNQFDPKVHGFNGINSVSLAGFPSDIDSRVFEATDELSEFPFNLDMNSGNTIGIGWMQATIKDGSRSSSATSYLAPEFVNRPNLHVLLNARVTRVLPTGPTSFDTVEFVQSLDGKLKMIRPRYTLTAGSEVILSAGSIGTPAILLHSGIGNSTTLSALGIEPLHNLPSVGQNLSDHVFLGASWLVNSTNTTDEAARNATLAAEELAKWNTTRMGPLVDNPGSQLGWLRIPNNSSIFEQFSDPSAGPTAGHFELLLANGIVGPPPPTGNFMSISSALVSPTSRGYVELNSTDPLAAPLINPNFLASDFDMFVLREALRASARFAAAPVFSNYIIAPFSFNATDTDPELDEFIRANAGTVFHPVGTAAMSAKGANFGVVDPDLTVKGLQKLRIVDLSVLPFIPASHTQASAYIIAERAADLIKAAQ